MGIITDLDKRQELLEELEQVQHDIRENEARREVMAMSILDNLEYDERDYQLRQREKEIADLLFEDGIKEMREIAKELEKDGK